MKKAPINIDQPVVSDNQAAEISEPCECALDLPSLAVSPKLPSILQFFSFTVFAMRANQLDFLGLQSLSQWITIVGLVCDQALHALFRATTSLTRDIDLIKRFFDQFYFRRRGRSKCASHRNTFAVDHHHPLRTFSTFGFSDAQAPFFAGAKLPSAKVSSQSRYCFSSSWESKARQTSNHMPISSHSFNRLQQVEGLGYISGKSRHRAPVLRTHKMPSRTCRLSCHGRPPFLPGAVFGSNGSIFFHWSSFKSGVVRAIGAPPIA